MTNKSPAKIPFFSACIIGILAFVAIFYPAFMVKKALHVDNAIIPSSTPLLADQIIMGQLAASTIPVGKTGLWSNTTDSLPYWRTTAGTDLGMTGVPLARAISTTAPLGGGGSLSSNLTLTCTTCAVTTGYTMSGDITLANTATSLTSGAYALQIQAGSATGGITLTGVSGNTATNNFVTVNNTNLVGAPGVTALAVGTGSPFLLTRIGVGIDDTTYIGFHCDIAVDVTAAAGGITSRKIVVWAGTLTAQDAALTVNLTTIAGIAITSAAAGGRAQICKSGYAIVSSTDAGCAVGTIASTAGAGTAGFAQCTVPAVFGAAIGKIAAAPASNLAVVDVNIQ